MQGFRDIVAWQKAHQFTLEVYRVCESFPGREQLGLTRQLTRTASSIGSNIAEGFGRGDDTELCRFL
jgi:four helix bundle protein